jgi:hypothetical protein
METLKTPDANLAAGNRSLISVIGRLLGAGMPDPDNPMPHGPWDPVIRNAIAKTVRVFGPIPDPWNWLNPQPLPPRYFFLSAVADEIISMVLVAREIAEINGSVNQNSKSSASYMKGIVDDWCGTMWLLRHFPIPPRPHGGDPEPRPEWLNPQLNGLDLVVLGTQFQKASKLVAGKELQQTFAGAAEKLVSVGFEKLDVPLMQGANN